MLERKIYTELLEWKRKRQQEKVKKCLIVKGARQVGKSYIIKKFGTHDNAVNLSQITHAPACLFAVFDVIAYRPIFAGVRFTDTTRTNDKIPKFVI